MTFGPLMLVALLGAHFFLDYAGQGDFMARAKNPTAPIPDVPWRHVLTAHAFMHGAAVALITGIWWLCLAEFAIHWITDYGKCRDYTDFGGDQFVHIVCKFGWFGVAWGLTGG